MHVAHLEGFNQIKKMSLHLLIVEKLAALSRLFNLSSFLLFPFPLFTCRCGGGIFKYFYFIVQKVIYQTRCAYSIINALLCVIFLWLWFLVFAFSRFSIDFQFIGATMGSAELQIQTENGLIGMPSNICCVVVEYLAGGALKSYLIKNRRRKLAFKVVVQLALDLARGYPCTTIPIPSVR